MQIQNALITGSFSYNGADLSNITSSNAYSASLSIRTTNLESTASSLVGASSSFSSILTSVSSSQQQISSSLLNVIAIGATTGSNSFRATQSITGSLTVTGQIIAQTLNVQQVTSSIVYSSGSNVFGCDINSRQTFTGSFYQTGSVACFSNTIKIGTDATITNRNISFAGFPTSICFGNGQSIYDNAGGGLAINGQSGIQFITCATASLNLSSAGFVGIGTTTPCRELHAKGEILFQSRNALPVNNSMYRFIPRSTENAFEFQLMADDASTEKTVWSVCRNAQTVTSFNILNSNVGIGTCLIPGDHILQIHNPNFSYTRVALTNTVTGLASGDGLIFQIENCTAIVKNQENNCLLFGTNGRESDLTITQTGRIGMGTAAPAVNLHIIGTSPRIDIGTTDSYSTSCTLYFAQSLTYASIENYNYPAGYGLPIVLNPSGGPGRGNVGIQTTSPALKLSVLDTGCLITSGNVTFGSQAKGIDVYNACSGQTNNVIGYWISTGPHKVGIASGRTDAASTWEVDLRFYTHPTSISNLDNTYENMRLYGGGNLTINGTLTQNGGLSDCRQKENLVRISNPLDIISCIGGYNFEWKEGSPARRDFMCIVEDAGLIAQEVETVMPNIVRETKWDCLKTLNYNGITALLVEGMKQQQCTINALKTCLGIS